jgi:hypothetical protein
MLTFEVTAFALGIAVIYDVLQTQGFTINAHGIITKQVKKINGISIYITFRLVQLRWDDGNDVPLMNNRSHFLVKQMLLLELLLWAGITQN